MDKEFPRSIRYCIGSADESLHEITGVPAGSFRYRSEQMMGKLRADLDFTSIESVLKTGLHEYLDGLQTRMNEIDNSVRDDFCLVEPITQTQAQTAGV